MPEYSSFLTLTLPPVIIPKLRLHATAGFPVKEAPPFKLLPSMTIYSESSASSQHQPLQTTVMESGRKEKRKPHKPKRKGKREEEHGLWSRLPPDISAKIFRLLPLHHAVKAKAVCQKWRTLLDSILHEPQSLHVQGDILLPVFLPNKRRSPWLGYQPATQTWRCYPSLTFLPFYVQRVHSSHHGLFLLEESPFRLYICNFSTQQHRLLPAVAPAMESGSDTAIYWYHLQVDEDREAYSIVAMMRSASRWPQMIRFDSKRDEWSLLRMVDSSNICFPRVFFEGIERIVVLSDSIYTVVPGRDSTSYLIEYDALGCVWVLVCKLHVPSAQIVAFQETFMVATLDRSSRQIHLHRFEDRQLLLEASTGPELAEFVVDCADHYWYVAASAWVSRIYVGEKEGSKSAVEYNAVSKTWKRLPLPDFPEKHKEDYTATCVCVDAYEFGITTKV